MAGWRLAHSGELHDDFGVTQAGRVLVYKAYSAQHLSQYTLFHVAAQAEHQRVSRHQRCQVIILRLIKTCEK